MMWPSKTPPDGWLLCDGSNMHVKVENSGTTVTLTTGTISKKVGGVWFDEKSILLLNPLAEILVNRISTYWCSRYGTQGNYTYGESGFIYLPNFSQRFPLGSADGNWICGNQTFTTTIGRDGGEVSHLMTKGEMPKHNHEILLYKAQDWGGNEVSDNRVYAAGSIDPYGKSEKLVGKVTINGVKMSRPIADAGGNEQHNNIPPFLSVNFIIKYC